MGMVVTGSGLGMQITVVNVFGNKYEGSQVYCVEEMAPQPGGAVTRTHSWKTSQQSHHRLWRDFGREPNREFNIGGGLRSSAIVMGP